MKDAELLKLAADFRNGLLEGRSSTAMCFAVCAPLDGFLHFNNYRTRLVVGEVAVPGDPRGMLCEHYWLELEDGRILDPTADQFTTPTNPMPAVYIGMKPDWYKEVPDAA
jgi:hypothetical protein